MQESFDQFEQIQAQKQNEMKRIHDVNLPIQAIARNIEKSVKQAQATSKLLVKYQQK